MTALVPALLEAIGARSDRAGQDAETARSGVLLAAGILERHAEGRFVGFEAVEARCLHCAQPWPCPDATAAQGWLEQTASRYGVQP